MMIDCDRQGAIATNRLGRRSGQCSAFSLLELLIVVAIIAALIGIVLPALGSARREGRGAACGARLRELGRGFVMYANDYDGRAMPLSYWSFEIIGAGPSIFWWGTNESGRVNHERGFLWPYLQSELGGRTVFECPEQPWGSYQPQGAARQVTSTYGYNGYYLSPEHTPGWGFQIAHRPWQSLSSVKDPARVFAFADAAIDLGRDQPRNTALLDPPLLFDGRRWYRNSNPTTSFRHRGRAQSVHVDGHVSRYTSRAEWLTSKRFTIGAVGSGNEPHYVPDAREWSARIR